MNNDKNMLKEDETKYVVKVHGNICSPPYPTPSLAEDMIKLLSEEHQAIAEIVPVTSDGKEILLG